MFSICTCNRQIVLGISLIKVCYNVATPTLEKNSKDSLNIENLM